jgi:preprotein translocase subunit YajC
VVLAADRLAGGRTEGDHVHFAADESGGSGLLTFLPIILLIAAMYFLMIRPQSRRRREAQELQSRVAPGDEVQTVGGLFATVTAVDDESTTLEAAPGVSLRYARGAIARVTNKVASEPEDTDGESDPAKSIEQA